MARRRVPLRIGPAPEPPPKPKPFTVLSKPRFVASGLPSDLSAWYARHEGVGVDGPDIHDVKICKLAELKTIRAEGLAGVTAEGDQSWKGFQATRIAVGRNARDIHYVTAGTLMRFGSIFAFVATGLVILDVNLGGWLTRLARDEWIEWGLSPASMMSLPSGKRETLRRHFNRINPGLNW